MTPPSRQERYVTRLRILIGAVALALLPTLGLAAPAQAIGTTRGCLPGNYVSHTNDWSFFWNHKIRVYERACRKSAHGYYRYLQYVRTPTVSFVSRGKVSTERVRLTRSPYVSRIVYIDGRYKKIRYTFTVRSCSFWAICNDWEFTFHVTPSGTTICVEKGNGRRTCDAKKYW
jgi:hypothetical protein